MKDSLKVAKAKALMATREAYEQCSSPEEVAEFFNDLAKMVQAQGMNRVMSLRGEFAEEVETNK
jgi:hypothetical protein